MLDKHIDLLSRRVIDGEMIPHEEKIFSIFQPWAEFIKKGKSHPSVEIGKNLAITTDQFDLAVDWQLAEGKTDNQLTIPIAQRLADKYTLQSLSVDKGFSDMTDKKTLQAFIPEVIMSKKGRRNKSEKAIESAPGFRRLKNKHHAVESNINELEHRGPNRCPNRTRPGFDRYVGLAITAYNLHKIGRELLRQKRAESRADKAA